MSDRLKADLALTGVALIWGVTFILVKEALEHVSTLLFLTLRFAIAAAALTFAFRRRGAHDPRDRRRELLAGLGIGACLFLGYVLQTAGLRYTEASKAGFITGFYIVLVPALSAVIYRRRPKLKEAFGVLMATAGMALMTLRSFAFDASYGDLLVLAATFAYAAHILLLGRYSGSIAFETLAVYQIATGAIIGGLTCWWIEPAHLEWTASLGVALAVTGLLATALAFTVQSWAQQFTTPTRTALIFALEPVFAWLASYAIAGEVLTARAMFGAALILAGILMVEL